MYDLPQSGILENKKLKDIIEKEGYYEVNHTPGLKKNYSCNTRLNTVVDDFGIKYQSVDNANHIIHALQKQYQL